MYLKAIIAVLVICLFHLKTNGRDYQQIKITRLVFDDFGVYFDHPFVKGIKTIKDTINCKTANHIAIDVEPLDSCAVLEPIQFWLIGETNTWSAPIYTNSLHFAHLGPGLYTLKVKSFSMPVEKAQTLSFQIEPKYYQHLSFQIAVVFLGLVLVFLMLRYRFHTIKKKEEKLENQIKERTETLNQINAKMEERQQELEEQKQELELYYHQVFQLAEIGQEITASLNIEEILTSVQRRVSEMMESAEFAIGFYNKEENSIDYNLLMYKNKRGDVYNQMGKISADDPNKIASWVFRNKKSIIMNNVKEDIKKYIQTESSVVIAGNMPESLLYVPLMVKDEAIGVITVQSYKKNSYRQYHLDILKTIAAYAAIAFSNSNYANQLSTAYQEQKELLEKMREQNKLIEKKNQDILDSIQYAKRIQNALLPSTKRLKEALPDSFILYRPKDIVSGDFYWFAERDNKVLLAVVDCTGHGVPGAFMSVMANSSLNEIVNDMGVTSPELVLNLLNTKISAALKMETRLDQHNDGMDIGFVAYDPKLKTIEFAGAKRPLYYTIGGELYEIKGAKYSIGTYHLEQGKTFEKTVIHLEDQAGFYLFTDGFSDQFGGKQNKKFMVKRLLETIHQNSGLNMQEQKAELIKAFEEWQGTNPQTDDVLGLGVRVS